MQVLYPAYGAMLRHLRSRALKFLMNRMIKKVKTATIVGFDASIDSIAKHAMEKFEKESRDVSISREWDASAARRNLFSEIEKTKYITKAKFKKIYNAMMARAARGLALGIGGMAGAGVAVARFIGDWDPVEAKEAGDAAKNLVRRIIKRLMLNLDNFNYSTITVSADDIEGDTANDKS
ncbi:hypothetical protein DKX38_018938 [Salix brachista]|uniref:Sey1/RHD3-like three-helix bundle domain-containing protein n=1 Tax=Salix brachista TaxID=2182728 RepID=A0A5N5KQ58_9ROSI|nr:hypothetical protein DKX38_018938 [Salix brachista]